VGQKTRTWTVAQRRAIKARHGHRCASPGCERRIYQIHHLVFWENGGVTAVYNGVPLCLAHHHLVHEGGWTVTYDPTTGITTFTGPGGQQATSRDRLRSVA
ncbi:MAG TPA: HNH endonuclease signature motif containing protein, partial [Acidimicrobiales bacterium]|nr:HNH endonuclease signature motif containing protein [Acidimicrobiales bacterium]